MQGIVRVDVRDMVDTIECVFDDDVVNQDVFDRFKRHFNLEYSVNRGTAERGGYAENSVIIEYNGSYLDAARHLEHLLRGQLGIVKLH
ncbi:hypothetical protein QT972_33700 [Microcoleus sp. herbarium7]|uniref:hypothetical protein n=1 Tax=Microcoleus sp. herbarium7 TaxID=3055435 RepID=UPI002FD06787